MRLRDVVPAVLIWAVFAVGTASADEIPGATYTGTHAGAGTVELTVSADGTAVTHYKLTNIPGSGCTFTFFEVTGTIPIVNHAFDLTFSSGTYSGSYFRGSFPGAQTAQGTLRLSNSLSSCATSEYSWTAVTSAQPPPKTLTVTKGGNGGGTVASSPGGISCGATCSAGFASGTPVTLTATPDAGSTFSGWSGDCSGTSTCTLTMSANHSATATFVLVPRTLTVTRAGSGGGTVSSSPAGISCGATCSAGFTAGTPVTLTATPTSGSKFSGWSGDCSGTGPCTLTMSADHTAVATFAAECVVPNLKGKPLSAAKTAIARAGCRTGKISRVYSSRVKKGRVIAQTPARNKHVAKGAKVNLVVSKGKRP